MKFSVILYLTGVLEGPKWKAVLDPPLLVSNSINSCAFGRVKASGLSLNEIAFTLPKIARIY